jgi:hypothetical protein
MTHAYFDAAREFIPPVVFTVGIELVDEFELPLKPPNGPPDDIGTCHNNNN